MKKGIIFILLIIFLIFVNTNFSFASSPFGRFFAGRIISEKAMEINLKEWTGYNCVVLGNSITIKPIGSPIGTPTSYFIPWNTISKTKSTPMNGKLIMGIYSGKSNVTCIRPEPPDTQTVVLDTVTLFGTSK